MGLRIEVMSEGSIDSDLEGLISRLPVRVYNINDDSLTPDELVAVERLLADPVVDEVAANRPVLGLPKGSVVIEVSSQPGVSDPEGKEAKRAIENVLGREIGDVSFAKQYLWLGELSQEEYVQLQKRLGNPLIHEFRRKDFSEWDDKKGIGFHFPVVSLPEVKAFTYMDIDVSDEELVRISDDRFLALNLEEMHTIQDLFRDPGFVFKRKALGLETMPIDAELESLAQTWSEHCIHKKFNGIWHYTSDDPDDESGLKAKTDSVFKSIICAATYKIAEEKDWLVSVFSDNAGVIRLNDRWNISHKVETHNHPSGIDAFGGADTGTGGVFRDPKSTGTNMVVVSSQYGFRVPHPDSYKDLPVDIQTPARTLEGVVAGVEDYGNKMGVPTMCGQVMIDNGWLKPVVYVGAVAVAPAKIDDRLTHVKKVKPGYVALSLGGKVGKDGIHGATGSSTDLSAHAEQSEQVNQSVQIGDPIVEKGVFEVMNVLQELGFIEASQDCGAGGWNSAVGELAEFSNGVVMDLSGVPEKYSGLTGWEKLISESQEREVIVIKPGNLDRVLEVCMHNNVEATKIAEFNDSGYYQVIDQNQTMVFLPMKFLHQGLPQMSIEAHWKPSDNEEPEIPLLEDLTDSLLDMVGRPNIQLYDWITTRYDHEVQGGSLLKPIAGVGRGRSDAVAYRPVLTEREVVIETWGSSPWQGDIDAYHMGRNNVVDAIGRVVAAGGDLERIAFNGNTTCPKPENNPSIAAKVIRMLKGVADAEVVFGAPTISGKDSTSVQRSYISTRTGEEVFVKAKPELLMSALAVVGDDSTLTSPDFKLPGDLIYVVGDTRDELGASEFYLLHNAIGRNVPESDLAEINARYNAFSEAVKSGLVHSAQYVAKGGLGVALTNSAIGGDLGFSVELDALDEGLGRADKLLYSETAGRFVVTVHPSRKEEFESKMQECYVRALGAVLPDDDVRIWYDGKTFVSTDVGTLREKNKGEIVF